MADLNGRDADVLRSYGTEIATALLNYPLAPSYLRGLALFTFENLMDGQKLPYRFAQLTTASSLNHARLDEQFGNKTKSGADKAPGQ